MHYKDGNDIVGILVNFHLLGLRKLAMYAYRCRSKDIMPRSPLKEGLATQLMPLKLLQDLSQSQWTNFFQVTHFLEQLQFLNEWNKIQRPCYFGLMRAFPWAMYIPYLLTSFSESLTRLYLSVTSLLACYYFPISFFTCEDL